MDEEYIYSDGDYDDYYDGDEPYLNENEEGQHVETELKEETPQSKDDSHKMQEEQPKLTSVNSIKPIISAAKTSDIYDFLIRDHSGPIRLLLDQIEQSLFVNSDIHLAHMRLGKLSNFIVEKICSQFKEGNWVFQLKVIEELPEMIRCLQRLIYIINHSSIQGFLEQNQNVQLDISNSFVKDLLLQLILKFEHYTDQLSYEFKDSLIVFFLFCLDPPEPFITISNNTISITAQALFKEMGENPTHQIFETIILAYFSHPDKMGKLLGSQIHQIYFQLESYLTSRSSAILSENDSMVVMKIVQLLIFISQNDAKLRDFLLKEDLYRQLYETIKFSDPSFVGNSQKLWTKDPKLIQSIVILIQVLISGDSNHDKRFLQTLLNDFLYLLEGNKFSFIYSILVPILTTSDMKLIPFCLHKSYNLNTISSFNNYLKGVQMKGVNANSLIKQNLINTQLFDDRQKEYFLKVFKTTGKNQEVFGIWKRLFTIDREESSFSSQSMIQLLKDKTHTVFIFNCSYQGKLVKFGVYAKNKLEGVVIHINKLIIQKRLTFILMQDGNIGSQIKLRGTSNDQSFFFFMDQDIMFHLKSNKKRLTPSSQALNEIPFYPNNMKDFVKVEFQGLSFLLEEKVAIYLNFGNLDLSQFNVPFHLVKPEDALVETKLISPDQVYLVSAEAWYLDTNQNRKIETYLQMFSEKEDLQSVYMSYLKHFRLEKISLIPNYSTLQDLQDKFINCTPANKKQKIEFESFSFQNLEKEQTIEQLEYLYDGSKNRILDLMIPLEINLEDLPFEKDYLKLYKTKVCKKEMLVDTFQKQLQGFTKVISIMQSEALKKYAQNLIVFFNEIETLLQIPNYSKYLSLEPNFFKISLGLLFIKDRANTSAGIGQFHKAVMVLFKALKKQLQNEREETQEFCMKKNVLQIILNKFEIYHGPIKRSTATLKKEEEAAAGSASQPQNNWFGGDGSSGKGTLSKKGVGYSGGSNDTSWMKNYNNGYGGVGEVIEPEVEQKNLWKNPKSQKIDTNCVFNDLENIKVNLGQEFQFKMMTQLVGCLIELLTFDSSKEFHVQTYRKIKNSSLHAIVMDLLKKSCFFDCVKQASFFKKFFQMLREIANNEELLDFFVWPNDGQDLVNQPRQNQTCVYSILRSLFDQTDFFIKTQVPQTQTETQTKEKKLQHEMLDFYRKTFTEIEQILEADEYISIKIVKETNQAQTDIPQVVDESSLRVDQFFSSFLSPQCIGGASTVAKSHHYSSQFTDQVNQVKIQRIMKEVSDLSHSLPITPESAIFVRYDSLRIDVMKSLIFGAASTPYAHGAFAYDMFFGNNYPNQPPSINLSTTGNGKIRFNPNLYHCGKVCLSLLGTWRGSSNESWNPNISTQKKLIFLFLILFSFCRILQLLISIQAIVMSEYVYFNEPGYEGQAGSKEGEELNRGYQNIVKIGNIRHAMIDQIKNPLPEFKEIIQISFYLKKEIILKEVREWLKTADLPAQYSGLVSSHNSSFSTELKGSLYKTVLNQEIKNLEKVLSTLTLVLHTQNIFKPNSAEDKKEILVNNDLPSYLLRPQGRKNNRRIARASEIKEESLIADISKVDVTFDETKKQNRGIDVNSADVTNRWSRYIGAMGIDAVKKQANAAVLIIGLNQVGVEIAKNIALSGLRRLSLVDDQVVENDKLLGQFFLSESDLGKNRAAVSLNKIQALNEYVTCDASFSIKDVIKSGHPFSYENYTVVVVCNQNLEFAVELNHLCRQKQIGFILAENYSAHSRLISDFGDNFKVIDKNGEKEQEFFIKSISKDQQGIITLKEGERHSLSNGDFIVLQEIVEEEGMNLSLNQVKFEVIKVINKNQFSVGDTRHFRTYLRNGIGKLVKIPLILSFQSLQKNISSPSFEQNLGLIFTNKEEANRNAVNIAFNALCQFQLNYQRLPLPWNVKDAIQFYRLAYSIHPEIQELTKTKNELLKEYQLTLLQFSFTCQGYFPAQGSILGGFCAQEVVKYITSKWMPINQVFIHSCQELIPDCNLQGFIKQYSESNIDVDNYLETIAKKGGLLPVKNKYDPLRILVGQERIDKIEQGNIFVVGAGAIGCELIKNLCMLGVGIKGQITITDSDVIENSNLNRQFLFREKHIRKPKSSTAAAAAVQMNKDFSQKIIARLDRVQEKTEYIFDDKFFSSQSLILNALDNIQARQYIDKRCVRSRTPLLDSGTLGPKGHVQVILPFLTETYGSQEDPQDEEGDIPQCTLKMFPEQTLHCVEWARDKFGRMFFQKPQSLQRLLQAQQIETLESKTIKEGVNLLKKLPRNFQDCINYGVNKFYKLFRNDILALMKVYPIDHKTKDNTLFWTLPKRPPVSINLNIQDNFHFKFVISAAALRATIFGIPIPKDLTNSNKDIVKSIESVVVPNFTIKENKLQQLKNEENKGKEKEKNQMQEQSTQIEIEFNPAEIEKEINLIKSKNVAIAINVQEFEKDNDQNFHVDFLHSMANCRALNYKLEPMSWIDVKLKAGRIIPALVTTTAIVAGLQVTEGIKILIQSKLSDHKNAFLNLSLPSLVQSEPQTVPQIQLHSSLKVNAWDIWEVKVNKETNTLEKLFKYLQKTYKLIPHDLIQGVKPIFIEQLMNLPNQQEEKKKVLSSKLSNLLEFQVKKCHYLLFNFFDEQTEQDEFIEVNVSFTNSPQDAESLKGIPSIRLIFRDY